MKALVTGATGFLGGALTNRLRKLGWQVTAQGRNSNVLKKFQDQGIDTVQANLEDKQALIAACEDQEFVFHCGALASDWGPPRDFLKSNVIGTQNVIAGCKKHLVKRLIHVSTPSIYFHTSPRINIKESDPLPATPVNEYARTKLLAEQEVDKASKEGMEVITIRPRAIFGPGDQTILPRVIDRLQRGVLRVIGDGKNVVDITYIENVVDSLLLCAEAPKIALGKKYNITNGDPIYMWEMLEKLCMRLGLKYPTQKLSYPVVNAAAGFMETICKLIPGQPEPLLTRYSVAMISISSTLDISAAKDDLGYKPRISNEEGFEEFISWWLRSARSTNYKGQFSE